MKQNGKSMWQGDSWLGDLDSNQDSQIQSLESYQLDDLPAVDNVGLISCHGLKLWVKRVKHSNFWLGLKLGVGIVVGVALVRSVWNEITGFTFAREFAKRGCHFQHEGGSESHPNGWMTQDRFLRNYGVG